MVRLLYQFIVACACGYIFYTLFFHCFYSFYILYLLIAYLRVDRAVVAMTTKEVEELRRDAEHIAERKPLFCHIKMLSFRSLHPAADIVNYVIYFDCVLLIYTENL